MRQERLARAMSEIDDDLVEEARRPFPGRQRKGTALPRWAACAACLAVMLTAALLSGPRGGFALRVDGMALAAGESLEIPAAQAAVSSRAASGTDIALEIAADGEEVSLCAESGGVLLDDGGAERDALTITRDAQITWRVHTAREAVLTLRTAGGTVILTARLNADGSALSVTADRG